MGPPRARQKPHTVVVLPQYTCYLDESAEAELELLCRSSRHLCALGVTFQEFSQDVHERGVHALGGHALHYLQHTTKNK